jgi:predicted anti-sigma-YlaC factor YlaD
MHLIRKELMNHQNIRAAAGVLFTLLAFSGCSINESAMRMKPETVGPRIPSILKKCEAKLAKDPDDQELILFTGSLYVMYANAFIQGPAEMLPAEEYLEREHALAEARKYYLRGAKILAAGLEEEYPGWNDAYTKGVQPAYLAQLEKEDVPLIYWYAAGTLSAYALNPFDLDLGMKLPELTAAMARAYELDPDFNGGALDDFYVLFYSSIPEGMGGDKSKVETHYRRALEKTGGRSASPYISYAQAVCIPAQDIETFRSCLESALAIKGNRANRLVNIFYQRKARYLLNHAPEFFAEIDADTWGE